MLGEIICVGLCVSVSAPPPPHTHKFNILDQEQESKSSGIKLPPFRGGKGEVEAEGRPQPP